MGYHPFLNLSCQETYIQGKDSKRIFKQIFEKLSNKEKNEKLEAMKRDIAAYREELTKPDFTEYKEKVEKLREKLKKEQAMKLERHTASPSRWFKYKLMSALSLRSSIK